MSNPSNELVTMTIARQLFGIPVLQVRDVLGPQTIACIPLAPEEIAGSLNLRGRIVTAIDVRTRLGLSPSVGAHMNVVVELNAELYSLIIDKVGEVLSLHADDFEQNPAALDARWRDVSSGIYRLENELLIVLDLARLLILHHNIAA